jgi:hypothetical protein
MVDGKSIYSNRLGLLHAGIHGLGTIAALAWFGLDWTLVFSLPLPTWCFTTTSIYHENIVKIRADDCRAGLVGPCNDQFCTTTHPTSQRSL